MQFLNTIKDWRDQQKYVSLLARISIVLEKAGTDRFKASWPIPPKNPGTLPWVPAKVGHMNKLENEGIVTRSPRSHYSLNMEVRDLIEWVDEHADVLIDDDPAPDLDSRASQVYHNHPQLDPGGFS